MQKIRQILISVQSNKNNQESILVPAKLINNNIFHISRFIAQSAKRALKIEKGDYLVLSNPTYIQQGYKLHIS